MSGLISGLLDTSDIGRAIQRAMWVAGRTNETTRWLLCRAMSYSPLVRGSAWRIAICMSRIGTPLTSPAVQKVCAARAG